MSGHRSSIDRGHGASLRSTPALRGLHAQTVDTIGSRIVRGQYAPGSVLPPEEFEEEFGISKTVLREVFRVLAAKGLVDARQKRGTFVRQRSSWRLLDADLLRWQGGAPNTAFLVNLAEVRGVVETAGARLAAQRRTDADLDALRNAAREMALADTDTVAVIDADLAFHRTLLDAAHNELLSRLEVVIEAGLRAPNQVLLDAERGPDAIGLHHAIIDAVQASDGTAAAAAVERLLEQASQESEVAARRPARSNAAVRKTRGSIQKDATAQ